MKFVLLLLLTVGGIFAETPPCTPELPLLMTEEAHEKERLCADAAKKEKDFIIVGLKTHRCDCCTTQSCLEETRNLSDPANVFIQRNFAVYHSRLSRNVCQDEVCKVKPDEGPALKIENQVDFPEMGKIYKYWEKQGREGGAAFDRGTGKVKRRAYGPGMTVIRVKDCSPIGFIPMDDIVTSERPPKDEKNPAKFLREDRERRAKSTNEQLREILAAAPRTPEQEPVRNFKEDFSAELAAAKPECDLPAYLAAMDRQMEEAGVSSLRAVRHGIGNRVVDDQPKGVPSWSDGHEHDHDHGKKTPVKPKDVSPPMKK